MKFQKETAAKRALAQRIFEIKKKFFFCKIFIFSLK